MTTLKELMLTDAEIEQIYNDWADQTDTSYDPAKMVAEAQLQKLIDRGDIYMRVGLLDKPIDKTYFTPLSELEKE